MKLNNIEFYSTPDGHIMVKPIEQPVFQLTQSHREIIQSILSILMDRYPVAFERLSHIYSKSERNREYYEFRMVHRFLRCNFGEYDQYHYDIDSSGTFRFEEVRCPLRGECLDEGVICKPQFNSALTDREQQILSLIGEGLQAQDIASELHISIATVNRHRENLKAKLHLNSVGHLIKYYHENFKK